MYATHYNVFVFVCARQYVCVRICVCVCPNLRVNVCKHLCMCVCVRQCAYMRVCVYERVHICQGLLSDTLQIFYFFPLLSSPFVSSGQKTLFARVS